MLRKERIRNLSGDSATGRITISSDIYNYNLLATDIQNEAGAPVGDYATTLAYLQNILGTQGGGAGVPTLQEVTNAGNIVDLPASMTPTPNYFAKFRDELNPDNYITVLIDGDATLRVACFVGGVRVAEMNTEGGTLSQFHTLYNTLNDQVKLSANGVIGTWVATFPGKDITVAGLDDIALRVITTITTTTTLDNTHYTVLVDSTSGAVTVNLPAANANTGRIYNINKIVAANTVTIDANGAETINGSTTISLVNQWESVTIQSNGTSWYILASF
jgi:hypothetical protein